MKARYNIFLLALALLGSCKKFDDVPPVFEELKPINTESRKVLLISIDGLAGQDLQQVQPAAINALLPNSKYTFNVQNYPVTTDASSWASMVTGATYVNTAITTPNFQPVESGEGAHGTVNLYRSNLALISAYKNVNTAVVTPWASLREYIRGADFVPTVADDTQAKDSIVNLLTKQAPLAAAIVNFRGLVDIGKQGGFSLTNEAYKNGIIKLDGYVKEIIDALKARKSYENEDWLIMVTTNHGGSEAQPTPGFLILNNPKFKQGELVRRQYTAFNLKTVGALATVPNTGNLYNPGRDKSFTVQMDVKMNRTDAFWPGVLYMSAQSPRLTGWMWEQSGGDWKINYGPSANSTTQLNVGPAFGDKGWHTLTMRVQYISPTSRMMSAFIDGVYKTQVDILSANLTNTDFLTVGNKGAVPYGASDFNAANLKYFNVALDDAVIKDNYNLTDMAKHPNYANLIGYWKMNEGIDRIMYNSAPNASLNMSVKGAYSWIDLGKEAPLSHPVISEGISSIATSTAITPIMLYWMKVKILPDFKIEGDPILDDFEQEFLLD